MNDSKILEVLLDWNYWGNYKKQLRQRPLYLSRLERLISPAAALVLKGVRRSGKSSLAQLYYQGLIKNKIISRKDCLIVNLEDPRFSEKLTSGDLHQIFEVYLQNIVPRKPFVILDEVQNVEGWERFVRFLLESKNLNVIITGSSSKMMDQEISTILTGRHVDIEVFPLNFNEILSFRGISVENDLQIVQNRIDIKRNLIEYLIRGGFPEVVLSRSEDRKKELLNRYFEDIVFKDLVKRYKIKEVHKLDQLVNLLTTNIATLQSYNRLKNQLNLSLDTVERFAKYLENAGLFIFLKKFEYSIGKQLRSIHKVYLSDTGFYSAKGFKFSANQGRIVENLVCIELLKKRIYTPELKLYYWRDYQQREVDFVVKHGAEVKQLIQVCWDISDPAVLQREIRNIIRAGAELHCKDLLIITNDFENSTTYTINGISREIRFVSLWRWLLE